MLIQIKDEDVKKAEGATFLDDLDMIISPKGGHLVTVAMKSGAHVCWACGEPFGDDTDHKRRLVEKKVGGPVPCGVHAKCFNGPDKRAFFDVMKGLQTRRAFANIVKRTDAALGSVLNKAENKLFGL